MTVMLLSVDHLAIYGLLVLLAWAMVSDACSLTIPNRIPLAIIALYPAWAFAAGPAVDPADGGIAAAGLLLAGLAAFSRGWCGGDAKLVAALALWAGPALLLDMLIVTAATGGVLALVLLLAGLLRRRRAVATAGGDDRPAPAGTVLARPIPYGIAIAFGGADIALRLIVP